MSFIGTELVETDEDATARLTESPTGSINRYLATLPVRMRLWPRGMLLHLPRTNLVVVPTEHRPGSHGGSWNCIVVRGHGAYSDGGWDIIVSADEIRRSNRIRPDYLDTLVPRGPVTTGDADV